MQFGIEGGVWVVAGDREARVVPKKDMRCRDTRWPCTHHHNINIAHRTVGVS